jgi:hypothetical protein
MSSMRVMPAREADEDDEFERIAAAVAAVAAVKEVDDEIPPPVTERCDGVILDPVVSLLRWHLTRPSYLPPSLPRTQK